MISTHLTIKDAIIYSSGTRSALYEAMKTGHLKAVKWGKRTLIPVSALDEYMNNLPVYEPKEQTKD